MTPGVPKVVATNRSSGSRRWAYAGIIIENETQCCLITTALLGSRDTHTFRLQTLHGGISLNSISNPDSPLLLLLELPGDKKSDYWSIATDMADRSAYRLNTPVRCIEYTGRIDEIGSWIDILDEDGHISLDAADLIRVRLDHRADHCLAGAPIMLAGAIGTAIGIVVAQSETHIYAQQACTLRSIGRNRPMKSLFSPSKQSIKKTQGIEHEYDKLRTHEEALA